MKKILIILIIVAVIAVAYVYFSREGDDRTRTSPEIGARVGDLAPDFKLVDYDGNKIILSNFRGKPVFINFWASWCPFCVNEMPLMAEIQEEFDGQFETIAINRGESLETAKQFSDSIEITGKYRLLLNEEDNVYDVYEAFGMPYSVFVNELGVIEDIKVGPLTERELRNKIDKLIR
jgi:thiol-disulfide isomerase/thioredoxin